MFRTGEKVIYKPSQEEGTVLEKPKDSTLHDLWILVQYESYKAFTPNWTLKKVL